MNQNTASQNITMINELKDVRTYYNEKMTHSYEWRSKQLYALLRLVEENEDDIVQAMQQDLNKPRLEALAAEVYFIKMEVKEALRHLKRWMKPQRRKVPAWLAPARASLVPNPIGVVLIISPWNYPFHLLLAPLIGAIAAGNCAVLKPSELTSSVSSLIATLVPQYLDKKAFKVYEGAVEVSQALLEQKWDHIFFTGSTQVGKIVMQAAAKHLCPVTLELGGKSPCIVDKTANLKVAAKRIIWGKFLNAGQTCVAPDYVMIHQQVYEEMLVHLKEAVHSFYIQHLSDHAEEAHQLSQSSEAWDEQYAHIVNERHYDRLIALMPEDERIVLGGYGSRESRWIHPTILRDIHFDDLVMEEEIFGPILPSMPVESMQQALALTQQHSHPLAAYVFTEDQALIQTVKQELLCGGLVINHVLLHLATTDLPFGGIGSSGMGSYHSKKTFEIFSHLKPVLEKSTWFDPPVMYPPYSSFKEKLMSFFLK